MRKQSFNDVNRYRTELVTNGVIVNDALRVVQSKVEQLNGKGKGEDKKLLHDINESEAAEAEDASEVNSPPGLELEEQPTHNGIF